MTLQSLFSPIVGQPVWGVRRTHGSCMFLEFGPPHPADERHGTWSLLVEFSDYVVDCGRERFTHADTDQALIGRCLAALDGRTLVEAGEAHGPHALALHDGGGSVLLMPDAEQRRAIRAGNRAMAVEAARRQKCWLQQWRCFRCNMIRLLLGTDYADKN